MNPGNPARCKERKMFRNMKKHAGKVAAVGRNLEAGSAEVVDATGMIVMPGFIETHRHTWQSCLAAPQPSRIDQ